MMVFHYHQKRISNLDLRLYINKTRIKQVKEFNFLGVVFDECLSWKEHTQKIAGKISISVGTLKRLKRFLPMDILKTIYNALILPHLNLGILLWGHKCERIFKLQKWAVRSITSSQYNAHTNPLFQKLKLLKVEDIRNMSYLKFHYKYTKNELPKYFDNMFNQEYPNHDHDTRNKNDPLPPNWKKHGAKNSIRFALLPAIEKLPLEISENVEAHSTVQALAKKAKFHFIESYSGGCNDQNCFVCKTQT